MSTRRLICVRFSLLCLLVSSGLLVPLACQPEISNYKEQMYVYATLEADQFYQTVIVDRSYAVTESTPSTSDFGVSGALVKLRQDNSSDSVVLTESPDTFGIYHDYGPTNHPWVEPCSSYSVSAAWDSFEGEKRVRVPGSFTIRSPTWFQSLSDTNLPVFSWSSSTFAAGYRIYAIDTTHRRRGFLHRIPIVTTDTSIDIHPFYQALFDSTSGYIIRVFALDSNLVHLEQGGVDTIGANAIGVIGAQAVATTFVSFTRVGR